MSYNYRRTVKFQDTDAAGVVYFVNVLAICHEAFEASLAAFGIDLKSFFGNQSVATPVVHASVDFFRPLYCGDEVLVRLSPELVDVDTLEISYEVVGAGERVMARAVIRHVCIDVGSRGRRAFSSEMVGWVTNRLRRGGAEEREEEGLGGGLEAGGG